MDEVEADGPSWTPIIITLAISAGQGVFMYCVFEFLKSNPKYQSCFHPKKQSRPHRAPQPESSTLFSWISSTLAVNDEDTLRYVGLDTFVFLRFLKLAFKITSVSAVFVIAILLPTYAYGKDASPTTTGYNKYTMANVEEGSPGLWIPLIVWYWFVAYVIYLFWKEWEVYMPLRHDFLAKGDVDTIPEYRYTLQVERIPASKRASGKLYEYFSELFPRDVVKATVCLHTEDLEETLEKRDQARNEYEKAIAVHRGKQNNPRPKTKVGGLLCLGGKKVDAISHFEEELMHLNAEAEKERSEIIEFCEKLEMLDPAELEHSIKSNRSLNKLVQGRMMTPDDVDIEFARKWGKTTSGTGFVTFNSLATKQEAVQCEISGRALEMKTYPAPEPKDVIWNNITTSIVTQSWKRTLANALWTLGILFWAIPVSFIQLLANLDSLKEKVPWLWIPPKDSYLYGLLNGYLPVILFLLLMFLVPFFITLSAEKFIRMKSMSQCDLYLLRWHFGFQIANLWLILIGGSIFDQLDDLMNDVEGFLEIIASAVPSASQFFLNILIVNTFFGLIMDLSGVDSVLHLYVYRLIKPDSQRSQRELDERFEPGSIVWGKAYPDIIFNFLVGMVYACMVPIIQPFCALFFGVAYLIYKYQALHRLGQPSEGGGAYFPLLFTFMAMCLITAEIIMAVYFGIKKGKGQAPLAFALVGVTVVFYRFMMTYYAPYSRTLSINKARKLDIALDATPNDVVPEEEESDQSFSAKIEKQEYAQPALRKTMWETEPMDYRREDGPSKV